MVPNGNLFPYSYYETSLPVLVVSDVDLIEQIMVKEFSKFNLRKV